MTTMGSVLTEALFLTGLMRDNGYQNPRPLKDRPGHYACIMPLMYTHAIITGRMGDQDSYDDRWCFHTYELALAALNAWTGVGEPEGWHRHPATGRRRVTDPETGEVVEEIRA